MCAAVKATQRAITIPRSIRKVRPFIPASYIYATASPIRAIVPSSIKANTPNTTAENIRRNKRRVISPLEKLPGCFLFKRLARRNLNRQMPKSTAVTAGATKNKIINSKMYLQYFLIFVKAILPYRIIISNFIINCNIFLINNFFPKYCFTQNYML